jgi:glycerol-3-phosphate dehydrogenase
MATLWRSKAFYLGSAIGLGSAYYINERHRSVRMDHSPVVAGLSKTDRLAGMDWRPPTRQMLINRLKGYDDAGTRKKPHDEAKFDLLIIGGGATGTGCALDAAARGLNVACVEKGDFSCGTLIISMCLLDSFP